MQSFTVYCTYYSYLPTVANESEVTHMQELQYKVVINNNEC